MTTRENAKPLPVFTKPLRRCIRTGLKTQTRRVITRQPSSDATGAGVFHSPGRDYHGEWHWTNGDPTDIDTIGTTDGPPFRALFMPGDVAYLREPLFRVKVFGSTEGYRVAYADDWADWDKPKYGDPKALPWEWEASHLTSIQFPAVAARTYVVITDVRVEPLQSISEMDCRCEMFLDRDPWALLPELMNERFSRDSTLTAKQIFRELWDSLQNPKRPVYWLSNPWVFAYSWELLP